VNIILFGPPGAGKGTQGGYLEKDFNFHKISTGDLLRDEINKKTLLGTQIKTTIDNGSLVSDSIIKNLVKNIVFNQNSSKNLIFDGYPRNLNQAYDLDDLFKINNRRISCVLNLKVSKEIITKRILGRQLCKKCGRIFNEFFNPSTKKNHSCGIQHLQKRSDDKKQIIMSRYNTYTRETLPVLDYYKSVKLLHDIDGDDKMTKIYEEIRQIIDPLDT